MAGIYLHIPFCRKACHYCNFHFSTSLSHKDELIDAMVQEIHLRRDYLPGEMMETIYFGGGTPSLLTFDELEKIFTSLREEYNFSGIKEITLEANPEDITIENLTMWKTFGINRLSIGVQGFQDEMLTSWNRNHNASTGLQSLGLAHEAGFENITADLIYGDPLLTDESWAENISTLISLGIPHLSCYALTVEPKTALHHQIATGQKPMPDDEQSLRQYTMLQQIMEAVGYIQYEVSNFGLPGFASLHNSSYWTRVPYIGIGPSAHSFDGTSRQWNVAHNAKYTYAAIEGNILFEKENLAPATIYNEMIMTGLRTSRGIRLADIETLGDVFKSCLLNALPPWLEEGKIFISEDQQVVLDPQYYFFADGIAADLFFVD